MSPTLRPWIRPWIRGWAAPLGGALLLALLGVATSPVAAEDEKPPAPAPAPAPEPPAPPGGGGPPPGMDRTAWRESTWPAPTAEDWKKPCLLTWQRTWDDAVAVARETGKPILVCINMDGEIASEHYAGVRYRQPEIAALYEPYVTVIASVYRHTPRDHDDQGRRIPCPRFGGVTCGEHIAIEPGIFEKFCDGRRIAPRHIMVELDAEGNPAKETYDVYYRNDTASVFEDIRKGIADRPPAKPTVVRGDRPVVERVASRDVADRNAVEAAYRDGDAALRRQLLEAAAKHADAAPLDLLRLAVFGFDPDLSKAARAALVRADTPDATTLVADALRVPMDAAERKALVDTLRRLGASSPLARWLAVVHTGLAARSGDVDPSRWEATGGDGTYPAAGPDLEGGDLAAYVERRTDEARERPEDPAAQLDLAEASLALALEAPSAHPTDPRMGRRLRRQMLRDARAAGERAEALGATGWRVDAVLALAAYYADDLESAFARAAKAVKQVPPGDTTWSSMAVLTVFAESRWKEIKQAVREKLDFPPEWLADVNAAYAVLLKHPLGTDGQVLWHYDLLDWLGAVDQATRILTSGIARFRDSSLLHDRLRTDLLKRKGPEGLEAAYDAMRKEHPDATSLVWFAGTASVAAGDVLRRASRFEEALAAYDRALARYDEVLGAVPDWKAAIDAAAALVLAGRARVAYQLGQDDRALADLLASLARSPGSAGTRDGMGITPGETAQMLRARLEKADRKADVGRLDAALAALDPDLLRPDRE